MFELRYKGEFQTCHRLLGHSSAILQSLESLGEMIGLHWVRSGRLGIACPNFLEETIQARCLDLFEGKAHGEKRRSRAACLKEPVDRLVQVGRAHQPVWMDLAPVLLPNVVFLGFNMFPSVGLERGAFKESAVLCQSLSDIETNISV